MQNKIVLKPFPIQIKAHRILNEKKIVVFGGAIRGSKTWWLIMEIFTLAWKHPKSRWIIIRSTEDNIYNNLFPAIHSVMECGINKMVKTFIASKITLKNNSIILLKAESYQSDKELNKFRGLEINGAGIDELNEIQEETFNKIIERAGSWQHSPSCPIKILATTNPSQGWVKRVIYDRYCAGTLGKDFAFVPSKIFDNPVVSANKDYLESLKNLPPYQYKTFVEGDWNAYGDRNGSEFYRFFDYDKQVNDNVKYNDELPLHISFDFNVLPYISIIICQIINTNIYIIDEITAVPPNNSTQLACHIFITRYKSHKSGVFYYGDPSGRKEDTRTERGSNDYTIIKKELSIFQPTYKVLSKAPNVVMRGNFINEIFRVKIFDIQILIATNCKDTIADFSYTKTAPDGNKLKVKVTENGSSFEKYGHLSDAFDYFICQAFEKYYNRFLNGGRLEEKSILFENNFSSYSY